MINYLSLPIGETAPAFTGCVMTIRPIGFLEMVDQGKGDEKVLAVGTNNPIYKEVHDCEDLYPHLLRGIEHFFTIYKELESKTTQMVGWRGAVQARELVSECQARYANEAE